MASRQPLRKICTEGVSVILIKIYLIVHVISRSLRPDRESQIFPGVTYLLLT